MLFAIFFCSAALGGACYPEEGKAGADKPSVTYTSMKACEKKMKRVFAPHATANISYACFMRRGDKWEPRS